MNDFDLDYTSIEELADDIRLYQIEVRQKDARIARLKRVVAAASAVHFDDGEYEDALEDCEKHGDLTFVEGEGYR